MYQLSQRQVQSLLNSEAKSLHTNFIDTLKSIKEVTAPDARRMLMDDLKEKVQRAEQLIDTGLLDGITESRLQHIVARSAQEHSTLARWHESESTLIPSFRQNLT